MGTRTCPELAIERPNQIWAADISYIPDSSRVFVSSRSWIGIRAAFRWQPTLVTLEPGTAATF
jgi:hypothetical protein